MNREQLIQTFVLAGEFKEGDLAIGGTRDEFVRLTARRALSAIPLGDIAATPLIQDGVSEALARSANRDLLAEISGLTIGDVKKRLLTPDGPSWVRRYRDGLPSEVIAAVAKVMSGDELATVAGRIFNPLPSPSGSVSIGSANHFGSRIQPNSP